MTNISDHQWIQIKNKSNKVTEITSNIKSITCNKINWIASFLWACFIHTCKKYKAKKSNIIIFNLKLVWKRELKNGNLALELKVSKWTLGHPQMRKVDASLLEKLLRRKFYIFRPSFDIIPSQVLPKSIKALHLRHHDLQYNQKFLFHHIHQGKFWTNCLFLFRTFN